MLCRLLVVLEEGHALMEQHPQDFARISASIASSCPFAILWKYGWMHIQATIFAGLDQ